jgi:glutamate-1-semialdehyde 2,1-aminomutase
MHNQLSVVIISKNEEKFIADAVKSALFADEVLILDSGSIDNTCMIAQKLGAKVQMLTDGILAKAKENNIGMTANSAGGMFGLFFTDSTSVTNFNETSECDVEKFKKFYHLMLEEGIYMAPSAYEAGFISSSHSEQDIQDTIDAAGRAFAQL